MKNNTQQEKDHPSKKIMPETTLKEIKELNTTIKTTSEQIITQTISHLKKINPNRPQEMEYFDELANMFGKRTQELEQYKAEGKKIVGYNCIFAPLELIIAAGAVPVRINSGWYDTSKLGDRVVPVEVCSIIRSTIGAKMIELSPFLELSDVLITVLTCDGMTKLSEILGGYKKVWHLSNPRIKDSDQALKFWNEEIKQIKNNLEKLTGNKITTKTLKPAILKTQKATKAFRRLQNIRKDNAVISGQDALLVTQTFMWDDIERWTEKTNILCDELDRRIQAKEWICPPDTPRVMVTGTPMFWPDNWKLPSLIEEGTPKGILVADELCSSERLLYDPVGIDEWTMTDMLNAIGERYLMACTCPCFTSKDGNEDRINWLLTKIKDHKIQGVIYYVTRGCMLYAMEYTTVKRALDKINIPVYYLDTDYTREDTGQLKTRVEAFLEMLNTQIDL
ncbi:MAG: 2-hydroxyacyl-CoA dehydratase family protein [Candidatus Bathyarchaeota archaeon]|uniref:2-hydroxyacyl-CoA dehydratase subunit D n=1 Tax=Candidatus Bathycorpusculum sp. TaxID=2994959 RepID=UPI00283A0F63|nr:2-hydroxyacyl-CoA dehydratase family protein [Candidatus Termiticorpusculum sp.]MCL2292017.1 2-hydroxyacyl-CoA dehydratase family protein [Candidatus Termiticorpusculum sp.]